MTLMEMSLTGSVMIVVVFLVRSLLLHRLPKKTFVIMWGIVILRLLVPVQITSRWSIYSMLPEAWTEVRQGGVVGELFAVVLAGGSGSMRDGNSTEGNFTDGNAVTDHAGTIYTEIENMHTKNVQTENMEADHGDTEHMDIDRADTDSVETVGLQGNFLWRRNLSDMGVEAIVRAGSLLCAGWFVVIYWISRRKFAVSFPVQNPFVDRFLAEHKLWRRISVRRIGGIQTPLTYGIWHPVILFPDKTDWTNGAELEFMLAHEYVHIRHFDALFKLVLTAAFCVHWFNPFVWLLYIQCSRDIELSCDETVVRISGGHSQDDYAMTLIAMAERRSVSVPISNGFSKNALEERIEAIMLMKRLSLQIGIVAVLLVAVMTVLFATSGAREESSDVMPESSVMNLEDVAARVQAVKRAEADKIVEGAQKGLMDEQSYSIKYFSEGMQEEVPAVPVAGSGYSMLFPADERLVSNAPVGFVHSDNEHIFMQILVYEGMNAEQAGELLLKSGYRVTENGDYRSRTGEGDARCAEIIRLVEDIYSTYGLSYGFPDTSEYEEGWGTVLAASASTFTLNTDGLNADGEALKEAAKAFGDAYLAGNGTVCLKYMSSGADVSCLQELKRGEFGFSGAWAKRLCMGAVEELSEGDETELQIECGNPEEGEGNVYLGITFRKEAGAMRVISFGWEG